MSDSARSLVFDLDRVLAALREDLLSAETTARKGSRGLSIKEAEVELSYTVQQAKDASGKLDFKVLGVGVGGEAAGSKSDSSVHRIKLLLVPLVQGPEHVGGACAAAQRPDRVRGKAGDG